VGLHNHTPGSFIRWSTLAMKRSYGQVTGRYATEPTRNVYMDHGTGSGGVRVGGRDGEGAVEEIGD
jgi:hypothetical protein